MSEAALQLLESFGSLPAEEQHEVLIQMLRQSGELPDADLSDNDLISAADGLFQSLDAEESHGGNGQTG